MNCEQYESLLADVLGGEASSADRTLLEAHCATCEPCRRDYASSVEALSAMRSLQSPTAILPFDSSSAAASRGIGQTRPTLPFWMGIARYAAGIVIAFSAGYLFHATRSMSPVGISKRPGVTVMHSMHETEIDAPARRFEAALASAHMKNPSQSDLAKCMIAVFSSQK